MYFKNKLSENLVPIVHANGPAKMEKRWDDAVNKYFSEPPCKGEMSEDITVITWSIPSEETLLENCFKQLNLSDRLIVIPMKQPFDFLDKIRNSNHQQSANCQKAIHLGARKYCAKNNLLLICRNLRH